jgi:hypothetical protein
MRSTQIARPTCSLWPLHLRPSGDWVCYATRKKVKISRENSKWCRRSEPGHKKKREDVQKSFRLSAYRRPLIIVVPNCFLALTCSWSPRQLLYATVRFLVTSLTTRSRYVYATNCANNSSRSSPSAVSLSSCFALIVAWGRVLASRNAIRQYILHG